MPTITLRLASRDILVKAEASSLAKFTQVWSHIVRKRRRWRDNKIALQHLTQKSVDHARRTLGISEDELESLSSAEGVDVVFGADSSLIEVAGSAPWEFFLSLVAGRFDSGQPFLVTRNLDRGQMPSPSYTQNSDVLFLSSAPGLLSPMYYFDTEFQLIRRSLGSGFQCYPLPNPTLSTAKRTIEDLKPGIIHLSGVDSIEGSIDLWDSDAAPSSLSISPGFFLSGENSREHIVNPTALSSCLCATQKANLITFDCFNSTQLAAHSLLEGVGACIAIQDEQDNGLLELFFANFYTSLVSHRNILRAYREAIEVLEKQSSPLPGGGVVLWRALDHSFPKAKPLPEPHENRPTTTRLNELMVPLDDIIDIDVRPHRTLNYSMLHNNRSLFKRLVLKTKIAGVLYDVRVQVCLLGLEEQALFQTTCTVRDFSVRIDNKVNFPLTSALLRKLTEQTNAAIHVKVSVAEKVAFEDTFKVLLLPINEWRDTPHDRVWLPCFILPSDPMVQKVVDSAQRYLRVIKDDPQACFKGDADTTQGMSEQVMAIWSALIYDFQVNYVAPPPTFSEHSQRLRSPTSILVDKRGTCIDLALLLCACMEWIKLKPYIFLLKHHALCGYASTHLCGLALQKIMADDKLDSTHSTQISNRASESQPQPWVFDGDCFEVISSLIDNELLIPIEATVLTKTGKFAEALYQGKSILRDKSKFESMFDVSIARQCGVTPLPIGG